MATVRTPEELRKPEYNYFIALKLSVDEKNKMTIEKAISKACGSTAGDLISRRLIELRQDMTEVMVNDATYDPGTGTYKPNSGGRKKEGDAAKDMKLSEVMALVQNMCLSNGMIFMSTLSEICTTANKAATYFTLDELKARCKPLESQGVKFIDNTNSSIPFRDFEKASTMLETPPAKASLYEYLGVAPTASKDEISQARTQTYNAGQAQANLQVKQLASNLCALVDSILTKDPKIRAQYDYYIAVKEQVWDQFKMRKTYGAKEISLDEYYNFADIIQKKLKLSIDDVEVMLGAGLRYWNLVVAGGNGASTDLEICPYEGCGLVYRAGLKSCPHCNRPLEVICWNCGAQVPFTTKQKNCTSCGAAHSGKGLFDAAVKEIDNLLRATIPDIQALQSALVKLKNLVPGDNNPKSAVAKKVAACEKTISDKIKEEETTGERYRADEKAVREQMTLKNFSTASSMANNMRRTYPAYNVANTDKLIAEIATHLNRAKATFEQVKQYAQQGNEPMMIEAAARVLEISADYLEARQFLQKYPPKSPASPRISVSDDGKAHLEWAKVGDQRMVTYTVIKKIGTPPQNIKDGTVVEENLEINFYEDSNIVSATPYCYGVFATRCGVTSPLLVFPGVVEVYGDVTGISQEVVPGKISVRWDAPQNFAAIEVWKKPGTVAPLKAGDGTKLNGTKEGFVDESCDGDNSYLIICYFKTQSGVKTSRGITRTFRRYDLIDPLREVNITQLAQTEFALTWKNPSDAKTRLVFSQEKLPCRTDTVLLMMEYNTHTKGGSPISVYYDNDGRTCFKLPPNTVGYVYPIAYNEQLFAVSQPLAVNTISGISGLTYEEKKDAVKIKGTLHPRAKRVFAKINDTGFVTSVTERGEQISVSREEFERDGGMTLKLKANVSHYITIFSEIDVDGKTLVSSGTPLGTVIDLREKTAIQYTMSYTPTPAKPFKVLIKFQADSPVTLPDMVLMKGVPAPLNKNAGTLVERIPGVELKKGLFGSKYTAKITVTVPQDRVNMKFKLFLADDHVKHAKLTEVVTL